MRHSVLIISIVITLLSSCSRNNYTARLVEVDSLLSAELNDSAYRVVEAIDEDELKTLEDRAYYQLLKTRTYILINKQSSQTDIIDSAIVFYQQQNNYDRLANCYYYKAGLIFNINDIEKYVFYLKKAEEFAEFTDNNQIKYKIYDGLAYANNRIGCYDIALSYAIKTLEMAQVCQRNSWLAYANYYMGYAYLELGKEDSALYYFDKTAPYIKYVKEEDRPTFLSNLSLVYIDHHPNISKKYLQEALSYKEMTSAFEQLASIFYDEGNLEEAYRLREKALTVNDLVAKDNIIHNLLEYDVEHGRIDKVCDRVNDIIAIKDSIISQLKNDTIRNLQTRFDHEAVVNIANTKLIHWQWVAGALIVLVLSLCLFIMWYRNQARLKLKDRQIKLTRLSNQVSSLELRKAQTEAQIASLENDKLADARQIQQLKDHVATVEQEMAEYERQIMEWTGQEAAKLRLGIELYCRIENNEKVQVWTNYQFEAFITYYDALNHANFKKLLRKYGQLTQQNTFYLILKDMGKSKEEIRHIMSLEKGSLRSIESRLRSKEKGKKRMP